MFKKRNFDIGSKMMWIKKDKSIIHKEKQNIYIKNDIGNVSLRFKCQNDNEGKTV